MKTSIVCRQNLTWDRELLRIENKILTSTIERRSTYSCTCWVALAEVLDLESIGSQEVFVASVASSSCLPVAVAIEMAADLGSADCLVAAVAEFSTGSALGAVKVWAHGEPDAPGRRRLQPRSAKWRRWFLLSAF